MIEVVATIKKSSGTIIDVRKTDSGEVCLRELNESGIENSYDVIVADGGDIIQAIMAVGGLSTGISLPLPMPPIT